MHFRAITRIVGLLVILFSVTMIVPGLVALIYRDGAGRAFSQTFLMALAIGSLLWWPNRKQRTELKPREGFLIVVLFWTVLGSEPGAQRQVQPAFQRAIHHRPRQGRRAA